MTVSKNVTNDLAYLFPHSHQLSTLSDFLNLFKNCDTHTYFELLCHESLKTFFFFPTAHFRKGGDEMKVVKSSRQQMLRLERLSSGSFMIQ